MAEVFGKSQRDSCPGRCSLLSPASSSPIPALGLGFPPFSPVCSPLPTSFTSSPPRIFPSALCTVKFLIQTNLIKCSEGGKDLLPANRYTRVLFYPNTRCRASAHSRGTFHRPAKLTPASSSPQPAHYGLITRGLMERPGGEGCLSRTLRGNQLICKDPRFLLFSILFLGFWHVSPRWGPKAPATVGAFCTSEYARLAQAQGQ